MQNNRKEYFILTGGYWGGLRQGIEAPAKLMCRVPGEENDANDDWVLITKAWETDRRKT